MTGKPSLGFLLLFGVAAAASLPSCSQPASQAAPVLPSNLRADLYPKWIDAAGHINWPKNDGFDGTPVAQTLQPGQLIDRFGSEGGTFFSPKGESYPGRALPYVCSQMPYTIYRVDQPIPVQAGKAAPWFGEPGGATQYETAEPAFKLREEGKIEAAKNDSTGNGPAASPCGSS
jgi:Tuberculosis necrotizing toxin